MNGAAMTPSKAATASARKSSVAVPSISDLVSSTDCRFFTSPSTGTNAWEKAPSAKSRRSRFGMRNATKKASVARPAPKARAMKKSRMKPRMRLTTVRLLTAARARNKFMLESAPHGKHQIRAQAREAGGSPPSAQFEPAHVRAHRDQEREEGRRHRRQGRGRQGAARVAAHHRSRGGERRHASQRRRPSQKPARARHPRPQVTPR